MQPHVRTVRDGHVLYIHIERPEVRNALSPQTYYELSLAFDVLEQDDTLWLGVLTGQGEQAFSAGRDLKQLAMMASATEQQKQQEQDVWEKTRRLTDRFEFAKPMIARLNGSAYGGGLELALACDLIIAADHVQFALPEPRRGLIATAGGVHRLPRQLGLKTAMGMLLTGRSMMAQRGYELGLINEVVPYAQLDQAVAAWVNDILACAPLAIRSTKACAMQGLDYPLKQAMTQTYAEEILRQSSEDGREGPRAFAEKRQPNWQGK